jgi:hypothetical protein
MLMLIAGGPLLQVLTTLLWHIDAVGAVHPIFSVPLSRTGLTATFRILPVNMDADLGWVVETTHGSGIVDTSIVYPAREKAQTAADSWIHLDEDWAKV